MGSTIGLVIAALALVISAVGIVLSISANRTSKRSTALALERHDVHWDGDWDGFGKYVLRKRGKDTAFKVTALVEVDGESITVERVEVSEDGEELVFDLPGAAAGRRDEIRQEETDRANAARSPYPSFSNPSIDHLSHTIQERVDWQTPLGAHKVHEHSSLTSLGDDED